ncbi:MAG TPA: DinB family protein [Streptosporangiaceae bacterium]
MIEEDMSRNNPKATLRRYLQDARDALLWKLEGLSEYDVRRPLVPTGTNLLGLVKHVAFIEFVYFGATFGRPAPDEPPWDEDDPMFDMFATPEESRADIVGLYRTAWAHSDATIEALPLDATGVVPHWSAPRNEVTLHRIMVHVIADSQRHAGHADIVRELIDGAAGLVKENTNLPDEISWKDHFDRVEQAARAAGTQR